MINCEWIRKQKKERPSLGSSPGPKCKPNVRLRVRCANTQQPCFSALCDAWLLRKRDEIRESSYIKYRAILERHIKPRLGSRRLGGICTASVDAFTRELLETDGLSVKTVHDILSVLHSVLKDTEARRPAGALAVQIRYPKGKRREMRVLTMARQVRQRVPGVPLFLGGGATGDNVRELLQEYDAVCVATWIKNGDMRNPVDPDRTRYFMEQAALAEVGT